MSRRVFFPLVRAHLSHLWEAELQENHGEPGPVPAQVQRDPVLGDHRDVSVLSAQQARAAAQEIHQDRCPVSRHRPPLRFQPRFAAFV